MNTKNKILITFGNPNGIGPEIIAKALASFPNDSLDQFILIGDKESFNLYFPSKLRNSLSFVEVSVPTFQLEPGNPSPLSGRLSYKFLLKAVEMLKNRSGQTLVTAPISKELIASSGIQNFTGHTTFLSRAFNHAKVSMLFASKDLNVILTTIHHPLHSVSNILTQSILKTTLENGINWCTKTFGSSFKIGVCGLNPHAGENGLLGHEEQKVIIPVIQKLNHPSVFGPFPADSLFYEAYHHQTYQLIVAMYHDQGLAPFKLLHFYDGINITLGLPFLRTSPDHGTAFALANKGQANEESMFQAIKTALEWKP